MTKDDMVHKLVSHSVQSALAESKRYWLSDLFERGFAGYSNLSTDELRRELQLRGLASLEEGLAAADDELGDIGDDLDEFDAEAEWDEEIECGLELRYRGNDD
jgi:hypothetical protein